MKPGLEERKKSVASEPQQLDPLNAWVEYVMVGLSCVWIGLVGMEFLVGTKNYISITMDAIWAVFIIDFAVRLLRASDKLKYLRENAITALSLILPALRVFRLARLLRFVRFTKLIRVISSINRAIRSLGRTLNERGLPYVVILTVVISLLGSAAFFYFERPPIGSIDSYGEALWFTGMILTTMGSAYWPVSVEGRILCFLLSLYAFAVFGYFTAALASFFIGARADANTATEERLEAIQRELSDLRKELTKGK
jgi:voltage-gated potassium channel